MVVLATYIVTLQFIDLRAYWWYIPLTNFRESEHDMAKKKKSTNKKQYLITDPSDLNQRFYEGYDPVFLLSKARTLQFIVENQEAFKRLVEDCGESAKNADEAYIRALRTEVYFTEFHQFEAFFALLVAPFQDLPHWLYLTTYTTAELKGKVQSFLDKNISSVTNGKMKELHEFILSSIYGNLMPVGEEAEQWFQNSLNDIAWLLPRMAQRYLKGAEYNAYKHGVRVLVGPTALEFTPEGKTEATLSFVSDDSVKFLELEDIGNDQVAVYEVWTHFKPAESINYLYFMSVLLNIIKTVRLAQLTEDSDIQMELFPPINRDGLSQLSSGMKSFKFQIQ